MRRATRRVVLLAAALATLLLGATAGSAAAHPLGNFSVNHLDVVSISRDAVRVHYVLDQAEIPTFQERGLTARQLLARKRAEIARGVTLTVDGRPAALRLEAGGALTHPAGQGGLRTTRLEVDLTAPVRGARAVELSDATFPDRVGWRAIVVARGSGTAVRSSVPATDPTAGLRRYPRALLQTPSHVRTARFAVTPGAGTVSAPGATGDSATAATTRNRSGDGLAGVFARAADGRGVLLVLLLTAFGWGMLHALSPGHGKAMVAAYLVGTRGTARHAVALGATVTVTHTIGVFALGLVTLTLSQYILPEDLYPWLNLASGLLIVGVGAGVLRDRVKRARREHAHERDHAHGHDHDHGPAHDHDHGHAHGHAHHHHHTPDRITTRGLIAMGASAGLIPCPSALVVLLGAVAQHQIALGLLLIVAFSAGLAATLVALGLLVVTASNFTTARFGNAGRVATIASAVSAVAIVAVGLALTARAVPTL
jgi:nickel/cobalt transporter (NicO) family protein